MIRIYAKYNNCGPVNKCYRNTKERDISECDKNREIFLNQVGKGSR